jgi:zinc transport system substrate-binding protein
MSQVVRFLSIFLVVFVLAGKSSAEPLHIVTSIPPVKTFVEKIGGEQVRVTSMVPAGADPHVYEPKPKQMAAISKAAMYFSVGMEFEDVWLPRFKDLNKKMNIVDLDAAIVKIPMVAHHHHHEGEHHHNHGHDHDDHDGHGHAHGEHSHGHDGHGHHHHHGELDPHFWLSPPAVRLAVVHIMNALSLIDAKNKHEYRKNFLEYSREIAKLDGDLTMELAKIKQRAFMVYHPAWGYFARDYGLKQIPVEIEGKEPKPAQLAELIDEAKKRRIKTIFVQPQFSKKSAEVLAEAIGGTVKSIDPLAPEWAENLRKTAAAFRDALKE